MAEQLADKPVVHIDDNDDSADWLKQTRRKGSLTKKQRAERAKRLRLIRQMRDSDLPDATT